MLVKDKKGALIDAVACHSPKSASNCFNPESAYQQDNLNRVNLHRMATDANIIASDNNAGTGVGNPCTQGEQSPRHSVAFFNCALVRCHGFRVSVVFDGFKSWGGAWLQRFLECVFPTPTACPPFVRRKHEESALNQTHSRTGTHAPNNSHLPSHLLGRVGLSLSIKEAML